MKKQAKPFPRWIIVALVVVVAAAIELTKSWWIALLQTRPTG
jgi:hypothetical protein